ncbi:MAG: SDR family oxidoreductase [Planctomycetes bacterium]|nr:SDR family oxidoreductase [Planctomycetota bacterium]NOG53384.1 SDR family oxidoreductase [Planctomycetota bacterium]
MSTHDLTGRVIAITGASAGIGKATAIECAKAGMDVVLGARRMDKLAEVADAVRQLGRQAVAVECDVVNIEDNEKLVKGAVDTFGKLDVIMANAGHGLNRTVEATSDADLREIFEVNFFGTMHTVRTAMPVFRSQETGGHVLITSSCLSRFSLPRHGAYGATKAAQTQMARSMRLELEGDGIPVSVIHPITTVTEFFDVSAQISGVDRSGIPKHAPSLFVQPAERVARAVVKCIRKPVPEVWTSHIVRTVAGVMVMAPWFHDLVVRKQAAHD